MDASLIALGADAPNAALTLNLREAVNRYGQHTDEQ